MAILELLDTFYQKMYHGRNSSEVEPCNEMINDTVFYWAMVAPAFAIIFSLAMTKPRRQKLLDCCWSRPGLVYPMDALTRECRISYAAAFGATAFLVYQIIFESRKAWVYTGPSQLSSLVSIVSMMIYGTCYFPIFACLAVDCIYGYAVGTLYVWGFLVKEVMEAAQCDMTMQKRMLEVARNLPHILCLVYLAFSFPIRFGLAIYHGNNVVMASADVKLMDSVQEVKDSYQGIHVRQLLKRPSPPPPPPEGMKEKIKALFWRTVRRVIYFRIKNFRYPARLLSVLLIGVFMLYMFAVEMLGLLNPYYDLAQYVIDRELEKVGYEASPGEDSAVGSMRLIFYIVLDFIHVVYVCFIVAISLTLLIGLLNILHMLSSFRTNVLNVYKGKNNHIPPMKTRSNDSLLIGFMRYAGYQVGYIAWGFIVQLIVMTVITSAVGVIALLIKYDITSWMLTLLQRYILNTEIIVSLTQLYGHGKDRFGRLSICPVLMASVRFGLLFCKPVVLIGIAVQVSQILLATFVFLQSRGGIFALDNRRALFIFTYYMFFYNIFLGLVSCLMRIIKAIAIGTYMLPRLDNSTLPRRFQFSDPGFAAYVGFIHVECAQTHPVLLVFLRLLRANVIEARGQRADVLGGSKGDASDVELGITAIESERDRRRRAALFNWYVAYTLINNPQIRFYRKGYIQTRNRGIKEGKFQELSDMPGMSSDAIVDNVKFEPMKNGHAKMNIRQREATERSGG